MSATPKDTPPHAFTGRKLRELRAATGLDPAAFADALDITASDYAAMERGEKRLPTASLPALARVMDAPLIAVIQALHGGNGRISEIHALAKAYERIPNPVHRKALLGMALSLSAR
jgi:transcriptional regulator with XRE-family HTH domain